MIEINGEPKSNAFENIPFCKIPKSKFVTFVRLNTAPLRIYTDWRDKEQGGGPIGEKIERNTQSWAVPAVVYTFSTFNEASSDVDRVEVRWYRSKAQQVNPMTNQPLLAYEDLILFQGLEMRLDMSKVEDKELFRFLMIHPLNELHASRLGATPMFKLVEPEKVAAERNKKIQLENQAIAMLYDEDKVPDNVAVKIHKFLQPEQPAWKNTDELVADGEMATIRVNLSDFIKKKPNEFIKHVNDHNVGLRAEIKEGLDKGVLIYDKNVWLWGKTSLTKNNKQIVVVPAGEDETFELIQFFVTGKKQGSRALEDLRTELKALQPQ